VIFHGLHATLSGAPPSTTDEALAFTAGAGESLLLVDSPAPPRAVEAALRWCAARTDWVEFAGEEPLVVERPTWEDLDAALMPAEVIAYGRELVAEASLPEDLLDEVHDHFAAGSDGLCTCRVCRGEWDPAKRPDARKRAGCKFKDTPPRVWALLAKWWVVSAEPLGSKPYALFQVKQRWLAARGAAATRAEFKRKTKEACQDTLKRRGYA